jgi:monoamine oxidase
VPTDLKGMIMTDPEFLIPEMWFRDVSDHVDKDEDAKALVVGFTTAGYAARIAALPKEEALRRSVAQLDEIFSHLESRHMSGPVAEGSSTAMKPTDLPKPSDVFLGGMLWDWNPVERPYIGGGYCSPRANTPVHLINVMAEPYGGGGNIFFAGEATNLPGATAHAALESGLRAAGQAANHLKHILRL